MRVVLSKGVGNGGIWLTVSVAYTNDDGFVETDEDTVFIAKADLEEVE